MVIRLFPVKPDINWFCLSTVVDSAAFQTKRLKSAEALYFLVRNHKHESLCWQGTMDGMGHKREAEEV